ncbi:unnamed protein product [Blepharisma stoltei]|uniref:Exophilin 5 n=1 Tax=Blepharisma stoltei TaxID=1481888 RepID=A0AAU9IBP7_9CILI|nr:unnamed protein product [Blepharisma stoltei]
MDSNLNSFNQQILNEDLSFEIIDNKDDEKSGPRIMSLSPLRSFKPTNPKSYISQSGRAKRSSSQKISKFKPLRIPNSNYKAARPRGSILSIIHEDPVISNLNFTPINTPTVPNLIRNQSTVSRRALTISTQSSIFSPTTLFSENSPINIIKSPFEPIISTPTCSQISLEEAIMKSAKRVKLLASGKRIRDTSWTEVKIKSESTKLETPQLNSEEKENLILKEMRYSQSNLDLLYSQPNYSAYKQKNENLKRKFVEKFEEDDKYKSKRIKYD